MEQSTTLVPSRVRPFFLNSVLQNVQKEAFAALIVRYIAVHGGNRFDVPFDGRLMVEVLKNNPSSLGLFPLHEGVFMLPGCGRGLVDLCMDGYLERIDGTTLARVTPKLLAFYAEYARDDDYQPPAPPAAVQEPQQPLSLWQRLLNKFSNSSRRATFA